MCFYSFLCLDIVVIVIRLSHGFIFSNQVFLFLYPNLVSSGHDTECQANGHSNDLQCRELYIKDVQVDQKVVENAHVRD